MRVVLTGATGFIGRTLLTMIPPDMVRLAVRSDSRLISGYDTVNVGDISDHTSWQAALEGADCVVHLAARVHIMNPGVNDRRSFHETNVLGTARLASAAVACGIKRFVFLSSIKVNGEATDGRSFGAHDVPHPIDDYGISKLKAEQRLFEIAASSHMEAVAIRPPLVYGPGVRANFLRLLSWVYKGIPLPLGSVANARSMVSVWNLCDLIKRAIEIPSLPASVLMVSDDGDISTPDLIRRLASAMDRRAKLVRVPLGLLKLAGVITGKSAEIDRLCSSLTVDIAQTKHLMEWTPLLSADEGLQRTAHWYLREAGRVTCP